MDYNDQFCGRKVRNPSKKEAERAVVKMTAKYQKSYRIYGCSLCQGWHLTSKPLKTKITANGSMSTAEKNNLLLNINKVTLGDLQTIPHIQRVRADRIIEYREKIGNFTKVDEVRKILGFGDVLTTHLKNYLTV